MICVKCGIDNSECDGLTCSNDIHIPLEKCSCNVCNCTHRTSKTLCKSCAQGFHRGEL